MPDWKKIKAEYISGNIGYKRLANKYQVSPTSLYRKMKKEKWADLKKQAETKAEAKIVESVANKKADGYDLIQNAADILGKKIIDGIESGIYIVDSSSTRQIVSALKDLRDIKGFKSELDMQEQMARIEKLRKDAEPETTEDKTIKVVIADNIEDYSN